MSNLMNENVTVEKKDSTELDCELLMQMLRGGMENLSEHMEEINDLNVFPIPDGDTGSNMLMTLRGGEGVAPEPGEDVGTWARRVADSILLAARGNSGVILSQFADGIAAGLEGVHTVDVEAAARAFQCGVEHAYAAVVEPVEGTILTVMREAAEYAAGQPHDNLEEYLENYLLSARQALANTPEQLEVLKKAGVVDSGGAGLIRIMEGAEAVLTGEAPVSTEHETEVSTGLNSGMKQLNLDLFTEDSVLEFGYYTELLLRLQRAKTDLSTFNVKVIRDYLSSIGDSIVCFQTGSIVKIHVHTKTPYQVLEFCQRYGEYLTVKIENMTLQHNNITPEKRHDEPEEKKLFGVVAVASGEGIKEAFRENGADVIVEGGQSMNPSTEDFIEAFRRVNADTIFVLPNNGNVILSAKQAASMYDKADVRVIESHTIGDGLAVLSMLDTDAKDVDLVEEDMKFSMEGVVTGCVARCSRNTESDGLVLREGQYIGFIGKTIVSADNDRRDTALMLASRLDFTDHEICILIFGKGVDRAEAEEVANAVRKQHSGTEVYLIDGGQEIYDYIFVVE